MPEGFHPFPSRTRKLRPPGPMILGPQGPGKVGRCQVSVKRPSFIDGLFAFLLRKKRRTKWQASLGLVPPVRQRREVFLSSTAAWPKRYPISFRIPNTKLISSGGSLFWEQRLRQEFPTETLVFRADV
jgi:hypothetical protein